MSGTSSTGRNRNEKLLQEWNRVSRRVSKKNIRLMCATNTVPPPLSKSKCPLRGRQVLVGATCWKRWGKSWRIAGVIRSDGQSRGHYGEKEASDSKARTKRSGRTSTGYGRTRKRVRSRIKNKNSGRDVQRQWRQARDGRRSVTNKNLWSTVAIIGSYSNRNTLFLDYDMARRVPNAYWLRRQCRLFGLTTRWISYRRTRRGWHVEVNVDVALTESEHVAAQSLLGSDGARESMNLRRALAIRIHGASPFWRKRWNILYSKKLFDNER